MKKKLFKSLIFIILIMAVLAPFHLVKKYNAEVDSGLYEEKIVTQKTNNINIKDMTNQGISLSLGKVEEENKKEKKEESEPNDLDGSDNFSNYKNIDKINQEAGEFQINVENISEEKQSIFLSEEGSITKDTRSNENLNEIEVLNNKIISVESGIVSTKGGYNSVKYIYPTIEEAYNKENGITISGGAFDGKYIETKEYEGEYFANVVLAGFEGYISLEDIQIIPSSIVQAQSHYENINGNWVFFEAVDPLTSNEYSTYALDEAPEWAKENTKYYSYDDENFYEDSMMRSDSESQTTYNYFQNLPLNSTANYTGSDYKKFLTYKKKTNSKYYNSTNAFVESQEKEQVNSLLLYSMANHEGAYGTSNLSQTCNNFFGFGAYDSDPGNACVAYKYNDPRSGIIAQAMHLKQMWSDVSDWRFYGSSLGDKSHGMNVKYASDPNWGKSISSMMYSVDTYLKGNENKRYRIGYIYNSEPFYTSSSLSAKLKLSDGSDYTMVRNKTNGNVTNPRILITSETSSALKLQLPTPLNLSNSTTCTFTDAGPGSYPNYDGTHIVKNISYGTGSFACDYGNDYLSQQKWYPKKDAVGNTTYKIINDVKASSPSTKTNVCEKLSNGNTKCVEEIKIGKKVIKRNTTETTTNGMQVDYIYETYDMNGSKTYYKRIMKNTNDKKKYESEVTYYSGSKKSITRINYNTEGQMTKKWYEEYYKNGVVNKHIESIYAGSEVTDYKSEGFASNGKKNYYHRILRQNNGLKTYESYVKYHPGNEGKKLSIERINFDEKGKFKNKWYEEYYKNGVAKKHIESKYVGSEVTDYKSEGFGSNGKKNYYHRILRQNNGLKTYESYVKYHSGNEGKKLSIERINFDEKGKFKNKWYEEYYKNGVAKKHIESKYVGSEVTDYKSEGFASNGKKNYYHRILRKNNGLKTYESYVKYHPGNEGKKSSIERINFKENGAKKSRWYETYDKNGKVTSHIEKEY